MKITKELINKIDEGLSHGLTSGLGKPILGQMCVEALICNVLGEPHNDKPSCVDPILNRVKVILNDSNWSSNDARAKGLRNLAILQLGTKDKFDSNLFSEKLVRFTCTDFLPWYLEKMKYDSIAETMIKNLKEAQTFEEMKVASAATANSVYDPVYDSVYAAAAAANAAAYDAYYAAKAAANSAYYAAYYAASAVASADESLTYFIKGMEKILIEMNVPAKDFID